MTDTAWSEHVMADDCPCRPDVQLHARGSARVATHRDMPRAKILDELVREAGEFGLYEATAEPRPTR